MEIPTHWYDKLQCPILAAAQEAYEYSASLESHVIAHYTKLEEIKKEIEQLLVVK